jgi:hypothetical protein
VSISTLELGFRLFVFLCVLVAVPGSFLLMFRVLDYAAKDTLIEQFSGGQQPDTGQLNAYFEQAAVEAVTCRICGSANGTDYTYCHNCQERLQH